MEIKKILKDISKSSRILILILSVFLVIFIGIFDYITGYEFTLSIFYLLPVILVTWYMGLLFSMIFCILSTTAWSLVEMLTGRVHSHFGFWIWNSFIKFGFFAILGYAFLKIKTSLEIEKNLSRIDVLTGVDNLRSFYEWAKVEIERAIRFRKPFSIVYLDIDNFKQVNDLFGHSIGDNLLYSIAQTIKRNIRPFDLIARLGGDEFVIFLPETGKDEVKITIGRIHKLLNELVKSNNFNVTFSIGVVTSYSHSSNLDELIRNADKLMYSAKKNGKNMIKYMVFD